VGAADIEQPARPPPQGQRFQFPAKDRPVPEVVPARGYPVEYFYYYLTPFRLLSGDPIPLWVLLGNLTP